MTARRGTRGRPPLASLGTFTQGEAGKVLASTCNISKEAARAIVKSGSRGTAVCSTAGGDVALGQPVPAPVVVVPPPVVVAAPLPLTGTVAAVTASVLAACEGGTFFLDDTVGTIAATDHFGPTDATFICETAGGQFVRVANEGGIGDDSLTATLETSVPG